MIASWHHLLLLVTDMRTISDQNTIQLTWQQPTLPSAMGSLTGSVDYSKTFCLSAFMVKKLSSDDLLKSVKNKGMKHREFTASLIRDKLRDADDEIATTSLRAQLVCPVSSINFNQLDLVFDSPFFFS